VLCVIAGKTVYVRITR